MSENKSPGFVRLRETPLQEREGVLSTLLRERLVEFLDYDSIDDVGLEESFTDLGTDSCRLSNSL